MNKKVYVKVSPHGVSSLAKIKQLIHVCLMQMLQTLICGPPVYQTSLLYTKSESSPKQERKDTLSRTENDIFQYRINIRNSIMSRYS